MTNFSRRSFLQLTGAAAAAQSAQPNILFIMADQFRYDCLGANGNRLIRTPNLERLASQSANFSNAFVQAPVCVPSRISFFTGRYPHSHRNRVNYTAVRFARNPAAASAARCGLSHRLGRQAAFLSAHSRARPLHRLRRGRAGRRHHPHRPLYGLRQVAQSERPEGRHSLQRNCKESSSRIESAPRRDRLSLLADYGPTSRFRRRWRGP
jgi:hypothetical protein